MIAFVEGVLVSGGPEAVVATGGLGLTVHLTAAAAAGLPEEGGRVRLWTHLAVREDGWTLFGFVDRDERAMFRLLLGVAGVGPKVALGLLSAASAGQLAGWLRAGDEAALARLPGIGKKSAARLVVELGQRVPAALAGGREAPAAGAAADGLREAMAVLTAMGLPAPRAEQALRAARQREPALARDLEEWVRAALQGL